MHMPTKVITEDAQSSASFRSLYFKHTPVLLSSNVGVNNGLAHRDLILFLHAVKYCVCACRCVCVSVCWLELIIIRGCLHVYVHVLLALWQAESEWADNERGVSEALYCMILLYSTPEGRKRRKCSHISPYITVVVCLCESD